MSTKEILYTISKNDRNMFLDAISSLTINELKDIDFNQIDEALFKNDRFPLKEKLAYAKFYNRTIYLKMVKDIVDNPYSSDYDAVLFVARCEESVRNKLLDILVIRTSTIDQAESFKFQLKISSLLDNYVDYLKNGNDTRAKVNFALYFGYLDEFYNDHYKLANMIATIKGYNGLISARTDALVQLARISNDKKTLEYINGIIEEIVKLEAEEYYKESYVAMGMNIPEKQKNKHIKNKLGLVFKMLKKEEK